MMALWAETCSKTPLINSFYTGYVNVILRIIVLWWILNENIIIEVKILKSLINPLTNRNHVISHIFFYLLPAYLQSTQHNTSNK
jgi:hypothetical protein